MRPGRSGIVLCIALLGPAASGAQEIARVLGVPVTREALPGAEQGGAAELSALYDRVWGAVSRHYVEEHGLAATPEDLAEFAAWHREFERRDRAQRARKLEELEARLAEGTAAGAERARLEDFRAVLRRMARADVERDQTPPTAGTEAVWVELWKLDRALYAHYGGIVGVGPFGQHAHGARLALLEDYERRGLLSFRAPELRDRFYAPLRRPPTLVVESGKEDFTPYWRKPIAPSYFPD